MHALTQAFLKGESFHVYPSVRSYREVLKHNRDEDHKLAMCVDTSKYAPGGNYAFFYTNGQWSDDSVFSTIQNDSAPLGSTDFLDGPNNA
jgi:hypothetical protein